MTRPTNRSIQLARRMLRVLPPALQAGVRVLDGAATALRGLVLVVSLVPVFTVVIVTVGVGEIVRAPGERLR
ncbi:MAG TPA: hypothetical protein VL086_03635 [Candidatus Nitrosotalea sp.]|jgi:hypothetical protein|nr:hypothetical protein [Candidatus Nitrosotalea sp.]